MRLEQDGKSENYALMLHIDLTIAVAKVPPFSAIHSALWERNGGLS